MNIIQTGLEGCVLIEPRVFADDRGYFFESFNQQTFEKMTGAKVTFVQDNESQSSFGVVRGLHMQVGEMAQAKLVRVTQGKVLDVAVDMREDSPTYLKYYAVELSGENKKQLFIPRGFAHGFSVLEDHTKFLYKCDNFYDKPSESGIHPLDRTINVNWQLDSSQIILSDKDKVLPFVQ
jgi:dTDP-4-dehydrorhamnose 3,5-epimerase